MKSASGSPVRNTDRLNRLEADMAADDSVLSDSSARVFEVARSGTLTEMASLLSINPYLWRLCDAHMRYPLHYAAHAGQSPMAQLLVKAGADIHSRDRDGWVAMHYACHGGSFGTAEWLLQAGAEVDATSTLGWQPLHCAVDAGHAQVARFLHARGANLEATTTAGQNALHLAADQGHLELVKWLVRASTGRVVRVADATGWEPIHFAARGGHLESLKWLLSQDYELVGSDCRGHGGWTPIHAAAFGGSVDATRFLAERPAPFRTPPIAFRTVAGWEPLHAAAHGGHLPTVLWLADNGADVNAAAADGATPLVIASRIASPRERESVLQRLRSFGAVDRGAPSSIFVPNPLSMLHIPRRTVDLPAGMWSREVPRRGLLPVQPRDSSFLGGVFLRALSRAMGHSEAVSREEAAATRLQAAWRRLLAMRVLLAKRMLRRLMGIMARVEHRQATLIQRVWRAHVSGRQQDATYQRSASLNAVLKAQAARQIRRSLDRIHLVTELKAEIRIEMEKGRAYRLTNGGELISWGVRYMYAGDHSGRDGLCYQHVHSRTLVPYGRVKSIAWEAICRVDVRDDAVCLVTSSSVKYYFRPMRADDPSAAAWFWALRLSQLALLLGYRYEGSVAEAAARENARIAQPEPWVAAVKLHRPEQWPRAASEEGEPRGAQTAARTRLLPRRGEKGKKGSGAYRAPLLPSFVDGALVNMSLASPEAHVGRTNGLEVKGEKSKKGGSKEQVSRLPSFVADALVNMRLASSDSHVGRANGPENEAPPLNMRLASSDAHVGRANGPENEAPPSTPASTPPAKINRI